MLHLGWAAAVKHGARPARLAFQTAAVGVGSSRHHRVLGASWGREQVPNARPGRAISILIQARRAQHGRSPAPNALHSGPGGILRAAVDSLDHPIATMQTVAARTGVAASGATVSAWGGGRPAQGRSDHSGSS